MYIGKVIKPSHAQNEKKRLLKLLCLKGRGIQTFKEGRKLAIDRKKVKKNIFTSYFGLQTFKRC